MSPKAAICFELPARLPDVGLILKTAVGGRLIDQILSLKASGESKLLSARSRSARGQAKPAWPWRANRVDENRPSQADRRPKHRVARQAAHTDHLSHVCETKRVLRGHSYVFFDNAPVKQHHAAVRFGRVTRIVGDHADRCTLLVQFVEQGHHGLTVGGVQISGGFVGK